MAHKIVRAIRKLPAGTVGLSPEKLERAMRRRGLSQEKVAHAAELARNTVNSAVHGRPVVRDTAKRIADALGTNVDDLLDSPPQSANGAKCSPRVIAGEWLVAETLGKWIDASNGLQFRVNRLTHCYVPGRQARGKCYDLMSLSNARREELRQHLVRHPTVCERIGPHPHVSENLSTQPAEGTEEWWVIDRWLDGSPLSLRLEGGAIHGPDLARLMTEIALGLAAMHQAKIVFRELAPSRILLAKSDGRVVLTEFELAKLLDTGPTVSADWPDDAYRAPEIESGVTTVQSDFYSWARILVHAATGGLPSHGSDFKTLDRTALPKGIWRLATDCLSPLPSDRPKQIGQLLKILEKWWPAENWKATRV